MSLHTESDIFSFSNMKLQCRLGVIRYSPFVLLSIKVYHVLIMV